jgi:hypothetical protein
MFASLAPAQLNGLYSHFTFKGLSMLDRCPLNLDISAPKIGAIQMSPKIKMAVLLKIALTVVIYFQ